MDNSTSKKFPKGLIWLAVGVVIMLLGYLAWNQHVQNEQRAAAIARSKAFWDTPLPTQNYKPKKWQINAKAIFRAAGRVESPPRGYSDNTAPKVRKMARTAHGHGEG